MLMDGGRAGRTRPGLIVPNVVPNIWGPPAGRPPPSATAPEGGEPLAAAPGDNTRLTPTATKVPP